MEVESTLGRRLVLDSLHSHDPNLGRGHYHPPYVLDLFARTTLKWFFFLGLQRGNPKIPKL
jgi:hypothetical protein